MEHLGASQAVQDVDPIFRLPGVSYLLGKRLTIALAILLVGLGIAASVAIIVLYLWGGQIETRLLLFGDQGLC